MIQPHRYRPSSRTVTLMLATTAVGLFAAFSPAKSARPLPNYETVPADPALGVTPPAWGLAAMDDALDEGAAEPEGTRISGEVKEQLDVPNYSYLRLAIDGAADRWVAVPAATSRVGSRVTVSNAELMTQFASASLKRTFDQIYFGVLDEAAAGATKPTEHSPLGGLDLLVEDEADPHSPKQAPHPGPGRGADSVAVASTQRAVGPLGRSVAELHQLDASSAQSTARVRGTVVKVTSGVLGRTFIHLRDGTGTAPLTHDLTATTNEEFVVGSQVLIEGTIKIDEDFGSGYRYSVLLADARRVSP